MHTAWEKTQELEAIEQQGLILCIADMKTGWHIMETGQLQWMAINSSEGIDKQGQVLASWHIRKISFF